MKILIGVVTVGERWQSDLIQVVATTLSCTDSILGLSIVSVKDHLDVERVCCNTSLRLAVIASGKWKEFGRAIQCVELLQRVRLLKFRLAGAHLGGATFTFRKFYYYEL